MKAVVAELRAFVEELRRRPDIEVIEATMGEPASASDLETLEHPRSPEEAKEYAEAVGAPLDAPCPPELRALYTEMNGVRIEWRFVEPPGAGVLHLPTIDGSMKFDDDLETFMNFGAGVAAMCFDFVEPEYATWYAVRSSKENPRILFAFTGAGKAGSEPAASLAEYLRSGMENGFVRLWQDCVAGAKNSDLSEVRRAIARFRRKPVAPSGIGVGSRIEADVYGYLARGQVLAFRDVELSPEFSDRYGDMADTQFAQIRLDDGLTAWVARKRMKALKETVDAYERIRRRGLELTTAPVPSKRLWAVLDDLTRATGYDSLVGYETPCARRAQGALADRPIEETVLATVLLGESILSEEIDEYYDRKLKSPGRFAKGEYRPRFVYGNLLAGLAMIARCESARRSCAGSELVPSALVERLRAVIAAIGVPSRDVADELLRVLGEPAVLRLPKRYALDEDFRKDGESPATLLGFPRTERVLLYTL